MIDETKIEQLVKYRLDGFVFPISVITQDKANKYRQALEQFERDHLDYMSGRKRQKLHLVTMWMTELVRNENILDAVQGILGTNLLCWQTSLFIEEPNDPGFVFWHQDANYWELSSHEVLTAWVALPPSTVESGCMKMIPGSHNWGRTRHKDTFDKNNLLTRGQVMNKAFDENGAVNVLVQPGEVLLHHVNIAYALSPN